MYRVLLLLVVAVVAVHQIEVVVDDEDEEDEDDSSWMVVAMIVEEEEGHDDDASSFLHLHQQQRQPVVVGIQGAPRSSSPSSRGCRTWHPWLRPFPPSSPVVRLVQCLDSASLWPVVLLPNRWDRCATRLGIFHNVI